MTPQLNPGEMIAHLLADGWKEYPDQFRKEARCFFKRFATPTRCHCNDDKPGLQVCVAVYARPEWSAYQIDIAGELPDETWVKVEQWAMPADFLAGLSVIPRMLAGWEAMANFQQTKPDDA